MPFAHITMISLIILFNEIVNHGTGSERKEHMAEAIRFTA